MTYTLQDDADIVIELGKIPSLNKFYSAQHWAYRSKMKNTWSEVVVTQLSKYDKQEFTSFSVKMEVNYRYDIDNCIMGIKFALDAFRREGWVKDDSPKYFQKFTIEYNPELDRDTSRLILRGKK